MSPKKEQRRPLSLNQIFELMSRRVPPQRINEMIDAAHADEQQRLERGAQSEANVHRVVKCLPYVAKAVRLSGNESQDIAYRDEGVLIDQMAFVRTFSAKLVIPGRTVYAQVKSSPRGIGEFEAVIRQRYSWSEDQFWTWMCKNRLCLLNGQQEDSVIANDFEKSLERINTFWATHGDDYLVIGS